MTFSCRDSRFKFVSIIHSFIHSFIQLGSDPNPELGVDPNLSFHFIVRTFDSFIQPVPLHKPHPFFPLFPSLSLSQSAFLPHSCVCIWCLGERRDGTDIWIRDFSKNRKIEKLKDVSFAL